MQKGAFEIAKKDATYVIEKTNCNDSPRIDEYNKNVGIPKGSPYCAASVYTWYKESAEKNKIKNPLYKTGSTSQIYINALKNPIRFKVISARLVELGSERVQLGDILLFASDSNFIHGHTAFVVEQLNNKGRTRDIEGNTTGSNIVTEQREQTKASKNKGGVKWKERDISHKPKWKTIGYVRVNPDGIK